MKVLLIDPPGWQKHSVNLGLSYLAGTLFQERIEAKILDMNNNTYSKDALEDFVAAFNPEFIGLSIKTATANISARIASGLKQSFPHIVYVAGGPHISLCAEEYLKENRFFDFGITGDGEMPLSSLARIFSCKKANLDAIGGLCYYRKDSFILNPANNNPEISNIALPRLESIHNIDFQDFRYPLLTSRGCPYGCIFCCVGGIFGKKWRPREAEGVIEELRAAKDKYRISSFEIMDDNFTFDVARAKAICRLLIKEKLNLNWWCHNGLRADRLDEELLSLMKKAGCTSIALGIETGDEKVFNNIKKGESLADIVKAVTMAKAVGLACVGYFIVGLPGDSIESTKKTVKFQRQLGLSDHVYNIAVPYPGTKMREHVQNNGRLLFDIKETYQFGDKVKVSFETNQLKAQTIEQCYHLANHQGWVYGEQDLGEIRDFFKSRFGYNIKRVMFIGDNDLCGVSNNLKIECQDADILEVELNNSFAPPNICPSFVLNDGHGYFKDVVQLLQNEERLFVNTLTQKLFLQNKVDSREAHIKGEALPDIREWDKPEGRYFATNLKYFSGTTQSAKNGIVYKDGIALPFSPHPEWEKGVCGKIESGLAFISLAAYNQDSEYSADYFSKALDTPVKELAAQKFFLDDTDELEEALLGKILQESDILFLPESLAGYAYIFSKAKINVLYRKRNEKEKFALRYTKLESFSPLDISICFNRLRLYKKIEGLLKSPYRLSASLKEALNVIWLWLQIGMAALLVALKQRFSRIITISR